MRSKTLHIFDTGYFFDVTLVGEEQCILYETEITMKDAGYSLSSEMVCDTSCSFSLCLFYPPALLDIINLKK